MTSRPRVMISYSSEDRSIALKIHEYLRQRTNQKGWPRYDIKMDIVSFDTVDFAQAIYKSAEQADAMIILISKSSIRSPWVQFELNIAVNRSIHSRDLEGTSQRRPVVLPVLLSEISDLPSVFSIISYLHIIDYTVDIDGVAPLDDIVQRLDNSLKMLATDEAAYINTRKEFSLKSNYDRLSRQFTEMAEKALSKKFQDLADKIDDLRRASAANSSILSPTHVSLKERDARKEIWVVSSDLYNDLYEEEFHKSILANYRRGIRYIFFVEDQQRFKDLQRDYENKYSRIESDDGQLLDNAGNFTFVLLSPGTIMPFDEVVLYDPRGGRAASGYVQLTFDQHPTRQTVYIDLPKSTIEHVVQRLVGKAPDLEARGENVAANGGRTVNKPNSKRSGAH